jgi:hypothetical protein
MMQRMRTTFRVDDDLLARLKARAREENVSVTRLVNRTLRAGLQSARGRDRKKRRYRERAFAMGLPRVDLTRALALAAALEDEEALRDLALRK